MAKRIPQSSLIDLEPAKDLTLRLSRSIVEAAVAAKAEIAGQATIQIDGNKAATIACHYTAFPNGDFLVWFVQLGYASLSALVNKTMKHLGTFPVTEFKAMQEMINGIAKDIGKDE